MVSALSEPVAAENVPNGEGRPLTHYERLGLKPYRVTATEVRAAAEREMRFAGNDLAAQDAIRTASDSLCDPVGKRAYDLELQREALVIPIRRHELHRSASCRPSKRHTAPAPTPDPVPVTSAVPSGTASHPQYELLREIGRGPSAVVHEGYDLTLRRYVAIKQLSDEYRADSRKAEAFWKEARFLAAMPHENIVRIHAVEPERGWIVMELMRGSLATKLRSGPIDPELVRSVLRQALAGLEFLHQNGTVHGQIKPASLLIDDRGRVKLSDSPGVSQDGEFRLPVGSQRHVAPELLQPQLFGPVGPAVDLYNLGFAALELLFGSKLAQLFKGVGDDGANELAWMRWHSSPSERLAPLIQLLPNVPLDLAKAIDRLIQKQVADRYASAQQALHDLAERPLMPVELPDHAPAEEATPARPSRPASVTRTVSSPPPLELREQQRPAGNTARGLPIGSDRTPARLEAAWKNTPRHWLVIGGTALLALCLLLAAMKSGSDHQTTTRVEAPPMVTNVVAETLTTPQSPPPEPALPTRLRVTFQSDPPTANVTIDNVVQSQPTPFDVELLPGPHIVRGEKSGCLPLDTQINVLDAGRIVRLVLRPDRVHTEFTSSPPGPTIKSKDRVIGIAPCADFLEAGEHEFLATLPGYQPLLVKWNVASGQLPIHFELQPLTQTQTPAHAQTPTKASPTAAKTVRPFAIALPRFDVQGFGLSNEAKRAFVGMIALVLASDSGRSRTLPAAELPDDAKFTDPRLNYARGIVFEMRGQNDAALRDYEIAVAKSDVPYFAPWRRLIHLRVLTEQDDKALDACISLIDAAAKSVAVNTEEFDGANALAENAHFVGQVLAYLEVTASFHANPKAAERRVRDTLSKVAGSFDYEPLLRQGGDGVRTAYARMLADEQARNAAAKADPDEVFIVETRVDKEQRIRRGNGVSKPMDPVDVPANQANQLQPAGARTGLGNNENFLTPLEKNEMELTRDKYSRVSIFRRRDLSKYPRAVPLSGMAGAHLAKVLEIERSDIRRSFPAAYDDLFRAATSAALASKER